MNKPIAAKKCYIKVLIDKLEGEERVNFLVEIAEQLKKEERLRDAVRKGKING